MRRTVFTVCLLFALVAPTWPATAQVWTETGNKNGNKGDAGQTLATADVTMGAKGPLTDIKGTLIPGQPDPDTPNFLLPSPDVDLYKIMIVDPGTFSATTVNKQTPATLDTELFLFDSKGKGIVANDDTSMTEVRSTIPVTFFVTQPGIYYLGISSSVGMTGKGLNPVSAGGQIFNLDPATSISGPIGPGGNQALSGWQGMGQRFPKGSKAQPYDIQLTNTTFAVITPEPDFAAFCGAGTTTLLGLYLRRRKRR
jgi:hypothetical protein